MRRKGKEGASADSRARGLLHLALLGGAVSGGGLVLELMARRHPVAHTLVTAAATFTVLGGTSLGREARAVHDLLAGGDLPGARQRLTHLVGRDTSVLDEAEVTWWGRCARCQQARPAAG